MQLIISVMKNKESNPPKKPWYHLSEESEEIFHHVKIFAILLGVLSVFSFLIPYLPFAKEKQEILKTLDFAGIFIALIIYTLFFLYGIVKHLVGQNPELKSVPTFFLSRFQKNTSTIAVPDNTNPKNSLTSLFNLLSSILLIISLCVTVVFAGNDDWSYSFSIPIAIFIKGFLILRDLPSEISLTALVSLSSFIISSTIVATTLYNKKEFLFSWWIPAFGFLGLGFGMATGIVKMNSIIKPNTKKTRTPKQTQITNEVVPEPNNGQFTQNPQTETIGGESNE